MELRDSAPSIGIRTSRIRRRCDVVARRRRCEAAAWRCRTRWCDAIGSVNDSGAMPQRREAATRIRREASGNGAISLSYVVGAMSTASCDVMPSTR